MVYLLFKGCYSARRCVGAYTSMEKAKAACKEPHIVSWEPFGDNLRWEAVTDTNDWVEDYTIHAITVNAEASER